MLLHGLALEGNSGKIGGTCWKEKIPKPPLRTLWQSG